MTTQQEHDKLEALTNVANRAWQDLYQAQYNRTSKWAKRMPYSYPTYASYRPTMVELAVLQDATMWKKFENELMEGAKVSQSCYRGTWTLSIEYVENSFPKSSFAKEWYNRMSKENLLKLKRVHEKERLVNTLKKYSPDSGITDSSNEFYDPTEQELELINEIIREKETHGLHKLQGLKKIDDVRHWVVWQGDVRKPVYGCCVIS
jgi:hypothetical protein